MTPSRDAAKWWYNGTLYQVYLMSFCDGNGDGIGDLPGLISRLPYLNDLGISAIWISPFTLSPLEYDCGYGPASLTEVNPIFGTIRDVDRLIDRASALGISIILEWAATNASVFGEWFRDSRDHREGRRADWFIWNDEVPNNWRCFGGGSAWHYAAERNQYYLGTFFREHADLNWRNPELQDAVLSAMAWWLDRGVGGFRIDTVNMYIKDRELRNEPPGLPPAYLKGALDGEFAACAAVEHGSTILPEYFYLDHVYTVNQPEVLDIIRRYRELCDSYGDDIYLLGEVDISGRFGRTACEAGLDQAFNFSLSHEASAEKKLAEILRREQDALVSRRALNAFSNHDIGRALGRAWSSSRESVPSPERLLALLAFTLPGTPMVYYGEEIGLRNVDLRHDEFLDPLARRYPYLTHLPVFDRERSRGAMCWDDSALNGGFSTSRPWIRSPGTISGAGVERQLTMEGSMWCWYRDLISLRKRSTALSSDEYENVDGLPTDVIAFWRAGDGERLLVVVNFSPSPVDLQSLMPRAMDATPLITTSGEPRSGDRIDGYSGAVLRVE